MRHPLRALTLFALLTLAACGTTPATAQRATGAAANPSTSQSSTASSPAASAATGGATITPAPRASASPSPASRQCAYRMTGYAGNSDVTAKLQAALVAGGFPNATAEVSDAGENYACNDNTSGFGLMTRDLTITLPVTDLADREALGTHLRGILTAAQQYATAPSNRYLVTFAANGSQERIEATAAAWKQASSQGLTGAALLDALQRPAR